MIVNDSQVAQLATQHLLDKNKKNILLLTTEDYISVGRLRTQGYIKALKLAGIPLENRLIIKTEDSKRSDIILPALESELKTALKENPEIDAILAVNEIYAAAAMRVIRSTISQATTLVMEGSDMSFCSSLSINKLAASIPICVPC